MNENHCISIIVPVLNEEGSLEKLYAEFSNSLKIFSNWELIFIDDGSYDESNNIMRKLADNDCRVSVIRFFKNFGKIVKLLRHFNIRKMI